MDGPADVGLRRQLSIWEAIGISVALMAPSMAANINPQGTAGSVGRAVPLAFALATVGVLFVAYTFVRLCQAYHHAGSVYGFVGATLGARPGVVAGWSLLGTYVFYGVVTSAAAGIFGASFLTAVGIWPDAPDWAPFPLQAVALVGVFLLAVSPARRGTRLLLVVEGVTVLLILLVAVVVLVRLLGGTAPAGTRSTCRCSPCRPAPRSPRCSSGWSSASCPSPASRPRPRWARRPATRAGTCRGPSSAPRSSAASTSCSSPRSR